MLILLVPFIVARYASLAPRRVPAYNIRAVFLLFLDGMQSAMPRLPPCKPAGRDAGARQSG